MNTIYKVFAFIFLTFVLVSEMMQVKLFRHHAKFTFLPMLKGRTEKCENHRSNYNTSNPEDLFIP